VTTSFKKLDLVNLKNKENRSYKHYTNFLCSNTEKNGDGDTERRIIEKGL